MSGCEILFEGSKLFPKIKKGLNVLIIEHTVFDVVEVILTNEPTSEQAESRMYIDEEILALKVGLLTAEGERKNFDASCYHKVAQKKVKYIVDRLSATSYSEEKKLIEFCVQFTFADRDEDFESGVDADSMVIERPDALFPYKRQNMQYILSDKCSTEASFSSVGNHRDSLAMPRHYQKPTYPRSMIPAATFSATGNDNLIQRAQSDVGQRNSRSNSPPPKRPKSGVSPVKDSVRRLLGLSKGAAEPVITNLDASPANSPIKPGGLSPKAGYGAAGGFGAEGGSIDSPLKDNSSSGSSKKEVAASLLSLPSKIWTSLSTLSSSVKLSRSVKVIPTNESGRSCPDDHTGSTSAEEKMSSKSIESSPNLTPLPSQRTNVVATLPTVVEPQ